MLSIFINDWNWKDLQEFQVILDIKCIYFLKGKFGYCCVVFVVVILIVLFVCFWLGFVLMYCVMG